MQAPITREFCALLKNLYCGVKILCLRRSGIKQAIISYDQAFVLISFYALTVLIVSYLVTPFPVYDSKGLTFLSIDLLILFFVGFALAKMTGKKNCFSQFIVLVYCVTPFLYLISVVVLPGLPDSLLIACYVLYLVWVICVVSFIILSVLDGKKLKAISVVILWLGMTYLLANTAPSFWYEGHDPDISNDEDYYAINQEQVYYSQYKLLSEALKPIKPGLEGVSDLYFVGFGSDANQDVFMKEVDHVQHFMNHGLGTTGRSIVLINNINTIDTVPLASSSNLKFSLDYLGKIMNREEDVVFLYLTSHGSQDHDLAVNMWPLSLNDLRPEHVKDYLDNAGIRWRIILVSACYAGGFIDPLMDENSLILTAAAFDKTSFGCTNENEFTYFGEALFKNIKEEPYQFLAHFNQAVEEIRDRELSESLPPSEPQLFIGNHMQEKIKYLEQEMAQYAPERFAEY